MKKIKKFLSLVLAMMLMVQPVGPTVFAAEIGETTEQTENASDETVDETSSPTDASTSSALNSGETSEVLLKNISAESEDVNETVTEETSETSEADGKDDPKASEADAQEDFDETEEVQPETMEASELKYRLLLATEDESILTDGVIISNYDGIYLIGYTSEEDRASGYEYYHNTAIFAEYDDDIFEIADETVTDEKEQDEVTVINQDDALTALSDIEESDISGRRNVIAVIDTGNNGKAKDAVSVIGEDAKDNNGHGSMVIDTILAENPNAEILSIKAFGSDGHAKPSDIYAAVRYAIDNKVSIINISASSLASADSEIVENIIGEAMDSGITVVGAAGNKGADAKYFIPGRIERAVIAGSCTDDGVKLPKSNYGGTVDYFVVSDSTSMASAILTGIISKNGMAGVADNPRVYDVLNDTDPTDGPEPIKDEDDTDFTVQAYQYEDELLTLSNYPRSITDGFVVNVSTESYAANNPVFEYRTLQNVKINQPAMCLNQGLRSGNSINKSSSSGEGDGGGGYMPVKSYEVTNNKFKRFVYYLVVTYSNGDYTKEPMVDGKAMHRYIHRYFYDKQGTTISSSGFDHSRCSTWAETDSRVQDWDNIREGLMGSGWDVPGDIISGARLNDDSVEGLNETIYKAALSFANQNKPCPAEFSCTELINMSRPAYYNNSGKGRIPNWEYQNYLTYKVNFQTPDGMVQVYKTDADNNILSGVHYALYSDAACTKPVGTTGTGTVGKAVTSVMGIASFTNLPNGTYYLKEDYNTDTFSLNGNTYKVDKKVYPVTVNSNNSFAAEGQKYGYIFNYAEYISTAYNPTQDLKAAFGTNKDALSIHFREHGMLEGRRASTNFDLATYKATYNKNGVFDGNPACANWTNADYYKHFQNSGAREGRLARPISEFKNMAAGVNQNNSPVVVLRAVNTKVTSIYVTVTKSSANTTCTKDNPNYSLKGTEIGLYETRSDAVNNKNCLHTFIMDENGKTTAFQIPNGKLSFDVLGNVIPKTFWLKETKAGKGYQLNTEPKDIQVTKANTQTNPAKANIVNTPILDPVDIYIVKNDIDGSTVPEGTGSLEGAQFTIKYYALDTSKTYTASDLSKLTPAAKWTIETKYDSKIKKYRAHLNTDWLVGSNNSPFYYETGNNDPHLPLGYISIQETKAPKGYTVTDSIYRWSDGSIAKDNILIAKTNESKTLFVGNKTVTGEIIIDETPIRGNFALKKVDVNNNPMANVQFKITNIATKESHTFMTDNNGSYNSSTAGLWFSKKSDGTETKKIAGLGALPTGTYKVEEQRCDANKGKQLEPAITFTVSAATTYNLSASGKDEVITNVDMPAIGTTASVVSTSSKLVPQNSNVSITDVVKYSHLKAATDYILEGKLMIVEKDGSYKPYQKNGKDYVVTKTFKTPDSYTKSVYNVSGSTTVTFNINSTGLEDKNITVFEKLYLGKTVPAKDSDAAQYSDNPGIFPVVHEDKADVAQTVYVPYLTTAAKSDCDQMILPDENAVVVDSISYDNLLKGETFTVKGRIVDKVTGKTVVDAKGKVVTAEKDFTATGASGTVEMTYKFDASNMSGKTLVCYESIYYKNVLVMEHADINDKAQTVYLPSGKTTASDDNTKTHMTLAEKKASITDILTYSNLIPDRKYVVTGTLIDKATGKPVISNGKEVISKKSFTPATSEGNVNIQFTFDSSILEGKTLVVFEDVTCDNKSVIIHHDINDTEQTIYIPKGRTSATDDKTDDHITYAEKEAHITDVLTYSNLVKGYKYTVCGRLYSKDGNPVKDAEGNDIISMVTFEADKPDGQIEIPFTFDASILKGTMVVVAEDILYNGHKVITHFDLNDIEQTITIPDGHTTALDVKTGEHMILAEKEAEIEDIITYEGLIKGRTYKAVGTLYYKETSEPVKDPEGKEIVSTVEFKAETENGEIRVPFKFDSSILETTEIVCFEDVYINDRLVFSHHNINDSNQTVSIPEGKTTALDNKTEQHITLAEKNAEITDYLTYTGLISGKEYTSVGTMYDADTEEPVKDEDGNIITSTVKFIAENESGVLEIPFKFDSSILADHKIVIFEDVYYNDRAVIIHHDINDTEQTIWIPKGFTTAKDSKTEDHLMLAEEEASIVDTISYFGLPTGQSYTASGMLIDKATGLPLTDKDGKLITASADFIPETEDGTVDVIYNFDASLLAGYTIVIYEDVYSNGKTVIVHHSLEDENQTIYIPSGHTEARDGKTETATGLAEADAEIIDRVYFENLIIDKVYECTGTLYEKETGEPVKDAEGNIVTNMVSFKPTSTYGFIEVPFKYDASLLKGKTVVSFEDVTYKGNTVFIHHDITDEKQSVNYPSVRTTATLKNAGKKVLAGSDVVVNDEVFYSNVRIGDRFKVKGYMVNKSTGEKFFVNGKPIEAEKEFVAETKDGIIDMQFSFNTTGIDKLDLVVFEELFLIKDVEGETIELMVASHADINDLNQTVSILTVPKTGDPVPIIPIAGASAAALAGIAYIAKKKKEDNE